jgi:hypothetical protein
MLRTRVLSLAAIGLVTVLCSCSSSDSGTTPVEQSTEDAAPDVEVQPDAAAEAAAEAGEDAAIEAASEAGEAAVKNCPFESDLSKATLPCLCGDTLVEDVTTAMPSCTGVVKCCPAESGLKCE